MQTYILLIIEYYLVYKSDYKAYSRKLLKTYWLEIAYLPHLTSINKQIAITLDKFNQFFLGCNEDNVYYKYNIRSNMNAETIKFES